MTLKISRYFPESDAISFYTGDPHDETDEIDLCNLHTLDYDSASYKPTSFELVLCASAYLPLSPDRGYDPATDTQTFGDGLHRAEFAVANGDLVAHWAYAQDDPEPDFYTPVAVQLCNASKHLALASSAVRAEREARSK